MIGNHLKALILLLQYELRSKRLLCRGAWRRDGVCLWLGHSSGKGQGIRTGRGDCATYKNSQLCRDATEKHLSVALHNGYPSIQEALNGWDCIPCPAGNRCIFTWREIG